MLSWLSRVQLFATLWTVVYQAPLSTGFSRQEYWSGSPSSRRSSWPRIKPTSLMSPVLAGTFFTTSATGEAWEAPTKGILQSHLQGAPCSGLHILSDSGHSYLNYKLKWCYHTRYSMSMDLNWGLALRSLLVVWPWPSSLAWVSVFAPVKWEATT